MWTAAEALPAAIAAAIGAAWPAGIANAWAAPELIWNCADAAVFMPITCPAGLTSGPPESPD